MDGQGSPLGVVGNSLQCSGLGSSTFRVSTQFMVVTVRGSCTRGSEERNAIGHDSIASSSAKSCRKNITTAPYVQYGRANPNPNPNTKAPYVQYGRANPNPNPNPKAPYVQYGRVKFRCLDVFEQPNAFPLSCVAGSGLRLGLRVRLRLGSGLRLGVGLRLGLEVSSTHLNFLCWCCWIAVFAYAS
jgi:hypothetical protein